MEKLEHERRGFDNLKVVIPMWKTTNMRRQLLNNDPTETQR